MPEANTLEELKEIVRRGNGIILELEERLLKAAKMDKINDLVEIEISDATLDYLVQRTIENSKKEKSYEKIP